MEVTKESKPKNKYLSTLDDGQNENDYNFQDNDIETTHHKSDTELREELCREIHKNLISYSTQTYNNYTSPLCEYLTIGDINSLLLQWNI